MTVTLMLAAMNRMLDDPDEDRYTEALKLQALNAAQQRVIKFLPSALLTELQASKADLTVPTTGYALSGLDTTPGPMLPDRYASCYVQTANAVAVDLWASYIWIDDLEIRSQNCFLKGSDTVPIAYVFTQKLFVIITNYDAVVTLYYVRQPKEMVKTGPTGYQVSTCELDASRHDMVVEAAVAQVLRWDGEFADAGVFEQHVGSEITAELLTFREEEQRRNWR